MATVNSMKTRLPQKERGRPARARQSWKLAGGPPALLAVATIYRGRKTTIKSLGMVVFGVVLLAGGCAKKQTSIWESIKNLETVAQLKSFVAEKEAQANAATNAPSPEMKAFFAAAEMGNWPAVNNKFWDIRNHTEKYERLRGTRWEAIIETWGAFEAFGEGDEKYSAIYASEIINSIPAGSIYFGATDHGRFLVTAMQKKQAAGDPFFTLSQNPLTDSAYLDYLRSMYGGKIFTLMDEDLEKSIRDYTTNALRRLVHDKQFPGEPKQVMPGEEIKLDANGRILLNNQMNVIGIRALLAKIIFDQNSNREFYIEEGFPLEWMYPYLEPHGMIFKLNRQPLSTLSDDTVRRDREYWTQLVAPMIGDWLKPDTTVADIAAFAEKVHVKKDLNGFTGDARFIQNDIAQKMFSKERSSIAGLYAWRPQHIDDIRYEVDLAEKQRMNAAADFAFRQAWALCPGSMETVIRYVNLLVSGNRRADALLVAETAAKMPEMKGRDGDQLRELIKPLQQKQPAE